MNIYKLLNQVIEYIENNLENEIKYKDIASILGMNEHYAQNVFFVICNISISEYIRNRRLSNAGYDLYNSDEKVIDVALKYQYDSATSFSRAFEKFHGIKPSMVKKEKNTNSLKVYSKLQLDENIEVKQTIKYNIIEKEELRLYAIGKSTTIENLKMDAPNIWKHYSKKYNEKYGEFDYGITLYKNRFEKQECKYLVAYDLNYLKDSKGNEKNKKESELKKDGFKELIIPKSRWIVIRINSQEALEIQKITNMFYKEFIPSTKYKFRELPELEYYHDDVTDFLIPLEN